MRTFSFRAECQVDVDALRAPVVLVGENGQCAVLPDPRGLPDVAVEVTGAITIGRLLNLMRHEYREQPAAPREAVWLT
jgi:hypothetical protein